MLPRLRFALKRTHCLTILTSGTSAELSWVKRLQRHGRLTDESVQRWD